MRGGCGGPAASLCEQDYHGVVKCALGWACWKTFLGRPEMDRWQAMNQLGNGLYEAGHYADALSVQEADLSMKRHLGALEEPCSSQTNLARTYHMLGRLEELIDVARHLLWVVESRWRRTWENPQAASNYAASLVTLSASKKPSRCCAK